MNRLGNRKFRVASILLPILILLIFISVSYAQNHLDITAKVFVIPASEIECKPDALTIGSDIEWINCFIELDGADVSDILLADLGLTVIGKTGVATADLSFSNLDDFDSDGNPDLQVRFSRAFADANWFSGTSTTTDFTFLLSGTVNGFPFDGTDPILLVKSGPFQQAHYHPADTVLTVPKESINYIEGIDLSIYDPTSSNFAGYFVSEGDPDIFGVNNFYSQGYLLIPRTVKWFFFDITVYEKQPITIAAIFKKYDDCYADNVTKRVYCEGSGILLVRNHKLEKTSRYTLDTFRFDVENYTVKIEGGKYWNDMISVSGVKIKTIRIF